MTKLDGKKIVQVAMKYAENNGWCDEVTRALTEAGLGEFLPNYFIVQDKGSSKQKWQDRWGYTRTDFDSAEEAISEAKDRRRDEISPDYYTPSCHYISGALYRNTDVEAFKAQMLRQIDHAWKSLNPEPEKKKHNKYPAFRAVEMSGAGEVVRVLWDSTETDVEV